MALSRLKSVSASRALAATISVLSLTDAAGAQQTGQRPVPAPASFTKFDSSKLGALRYRMIGPARGGRVTTVTGASWNNISDGYFASASMGSIDVADSDPNVIYAGTGSDAIRSNVSIGRGIYKSTDAGRTWKFVGLPDAGQIGAIVVHPTNPDIVFAAVL